ncbi:MAG: nucleotide exchange factor GrpE [Methanotrichaceae archaeon]
MMRHKGSVEMDASEGLSEEAAEDMANADVAIEDTAKEDMNEDEIPKEDIDRISKDLEDARKLADERLDQLRRCRAELDNVLRRTAREKEELAKYASEKLICKLLCVLDSLEQASKHDEGSRVLFMQLLDILKSEGLSPIDSIGKKFDPYIHEAMFQINSEDAEDGTVAQELQRGYALNSKVIRFSKVAVAKR